MSVNHHDDPGWPRTWKTVLAFAIPFAGPFILRRESSDHPLKALRVLYIELFGTPLYLLLVLWAMRTGPIFTFDDAVSLGIVTATGLFSWRAVGYTCGRALDATTLEPLAASYRNLFFLGFAAAEAPMLVGFALFFVANAGLGTYLVGMAFSLWGLWRIAPSRSNIARRQVEIHTQGSTLSLVAALSEPRDDGTDP